MRPASKVLQHAYAHLDDDDTAKPLTRGEFPRTFISIPKPVPVANPDFDTSVQTLTYRTMAGATLVGLSGDAVRGCVKYQFGIVIDPERKGEAGARSVEEVVHDMASFLGDLRLEPVLDPVARFREFPPPHFGDGVLQPISACVRS